MPFKPEEAYERVLRDYRHAADFKETYNTTAVNFYRLYKNWQDPVLRKELANRGRSSVQIAKAAEFVESKLPRYVEALFANAPEFVVLQPREPDDEPFVDNATLVMNYWMEQAGIADLLIAGLKEACITGTFVAMPYWNRQEISRQRWVTFTEYLRTNGRLPDKRYWTDELTAALEAVGGDPMNLQVELLEVHQAPMQTVDVEEGPAIERVPFTDFYVDPRAKDHKLTGAQFAMRRFRSTLSDLKAVNESLKAKGLPARYINLDKLEKDGGDAGYTSGQSRYYDAVNSGFNDGYADGTHDLLEAWYSDGWVYTLANESVVVRREQWPHWHGKLPFVLYVPHPDLYSPFGISMFDWIQDELADLNETARAARDLMNLMLAPPMFIQEEAVVNPFDLQNIRPNKVILLERGGTAREAMEFMPLPQNYPQSQADIQAITQRMQSVTGLSDPIRGQPITRRTTGLEQQILVEEGSTRLKLDIRVLNESFKLTANHFLWLGQQYAPARLILRVQGKNGQRGFTDVPRDNIDRNFDVFPASSSIEALANKGAQLQALVNALNVLSNTPAAQTLDWTEMTRVVLHLSGVRHAARMLPDAQARMTQVEAALQDPQIAQQVIQMVMQMMQQQQQEQAPPVEPAQVSSGAATPAEQAGRTEEQQAQLENEQLLLGRQVPVDAREPHQIHLPFHMQALQVARAEGMDEAALMEHIRGHADAMGMGGLDAATTGQAGGGGVPAGFGSPAPIGGQ